MKKLLATALLGLILAPVGAVASSPEAPKPFWTERPCKMEDSVNCVWDAGTSGNGAGHSFIVRKVPGSKGMVCVFYTDRDFARKHDYCS